MAVAQIELGERGSFGKLFTWLLGLGLIARDGTDEEAYWVHLYEQHRLPFEAIRQAILAAPVLSSRYFPTAAELRQMAEPFARRMRAAQLVRSAEDEQLLAAPLRKELASDNPFQQLAEQWAEESRRLGLEPERNSPREIGCRRARELGALLEQHPIGGDL